MDDGNSRVVRPAFDVGREGGTAEPCTFCRALLDATHTILEKSRQKRDHRSESAQQRAKIPFVAQLGRIDEVMVNSNCQRHKEFLGNVFSARIASGKIDDWNKDDTFEVRWSPRKGVAVLEMCFNSGGYRPEEILLLGGQQRDAELSCMERPRDERFISISLLKRWIFSCEHNHRTSCCVPTRPSTSLSWMIDTISGCLVPAGESPRYVALSYVWGQTEMLKATAETLGILKKAGALGGNTHFRIPAVIRHAIALVPQLGERYLWVDALCIPQDDPECLQRHIRHMASIYEAALFTLVAADGSDAKHGILGIKGVSRARKLPPTLMLSPQLCVRARRFVNILKSPWGSRGWTLQEHIFSKRKLVFVHGSVQWICQESRCFEDLCKEFPSNRGIRPQDQDDYREIESVGDLALNYPNILQLETLLQQYTLRHLTYKEDVLHAVEAIFTAHRQAFPHGFIWGLPIDFLDSALLWSGLSCNPGLERRQESRSPSRSHFPSWSWAGWVGKIDQGQWHSANYLKESFLRLGWRRWNCTTIPMLEWRTRENSNSPELPIPGQNSAYAYKQRFMGNDKGLPRGWRYENEEYGPQPAFTLWWDTRPPLGNWALRTSYYYVHESAPGVKFWHPVPIASDSTCVTAIQNSSRLLCAKTHIGRLRAVTAKEGMTTGDGTCFLDETGRLMGNLFNNTSEVTTVFINAEWEIVGDLCIDEVCDRRLVGDRSCPRDEAVICCELVAISKGNAFLQPMEPRKEIYTFYNVLWIKWEDGIAYRRGGGRVEKETWENLEKEHVDLVLG